MTRLFPNGTQNPNNKSQREMTPKEIMLAESKKFSAEMKEYEEKYSERDEDGNIIERAVMPSHGGYYSTYFKALERAMEVYSNKKLDEYKASLNGG